MFSSGPIMALAGGGSILGVQVSAWLGSEANQAPRGPPGSCSWQRRPAASAARLVSVPEPAPMLHGAVTALLMISKVRRLAYCSSLIYPVTSTYGRRKLLSRTVVPQIIHCPAILDDQKRYPLGAVLCQEYPDSENQRESFYAPEDGVKQFFVAGYSLVISDVPKELPHNPIFAPSVSERQRL